MSTLAVAKLATTNWQPFVGQMVQTTIDAVMHWQGHDVIPHLATERSITTNKKAPRNFF